MSFKSGKQLKTQLLSFLFYQPPNVSIKIMDFHSEETSRDTNFSKT